MAEPKLARATFPEFSLFLVDGVPQVHIDTHSDYLTLRLTDDEDHSLYEVTLYVEHAGQAHRLGDRITAALEADRRRQRYTRPLPRPRPARQRSRKARP